MRRNARLTFFNLISFFGVFLFLTSCARPFWWGPENTATKPDKAIIKSIPVSTPDGSEICSFNIQFLGNSKVRKNQELANMLNEHKCTMVVIQEVVAPPDLRLLPGNEYYGKSELPVFPQTKNPWKPQPAVTDFFISMQAVGYDGFWISEQDTGPGEANENNGSATEWWVIFYKKSIWKEARDLPHGFLDQKVTANANWDRVPYAFSMRHVSDKFDLVLIDVHLRPGAEGSSVERRKVELSSIQNWIQSKREQQSERDYVVIGDCNIEGNKELSSLVNFDFISLNQLALLMTNTNINSPKPYDHVFFDPLSSTEISATKGLEVISLVNEMRKTWSVMNGDYPGDQYNHNLFRFYYSDHNPIKITIDLPDQDDD